jgi:hypothetical protein
MIEVKLNNLSNHEWCPLCDRYVNVDCGPWPFMRGTWRPVCSDCAEARGVLEPYAAHLCDSDKARWHEQVAAEQPPTPRSRVQ